MGHGIPEPEIAWMRGVISRIAPEEDDYLEGVIQSFKHHFWNRKSPIGFGLDVPLDSITPVVVALVSWAAGVGQGLVDDEIKDRVRARLSRFKERKAKVPQRPNPATEESVTCALREYGQSLGLDDATAANVAEAVVALMKR